MLALAPLNAELQRARESQVTPSDLSKRGVLSQHETLWSERKPHKRTASGVYWGMPHARGERLKQTNANVPMITRKRQTLSKTKHFTRASEEHR